VKRLAQRHVRKSEAVSERNLYVLDIELDDDVDMSIMTSIKTSSVASGNEIAINLEELVHNVVGSAATKNSIGLMPPILYIHS
jgi:hypothetical protein